MDSKIARAILLRELDRYRGHSYAELEARVGDNALRTEINQDDVTYQVVIDFAWDDKQMAPCVCSVRLTTVVGAPSSRFATPS